MYQKIITKREEGQRFDKYLHKLLPEAGSGFLYKMLRKKNIVLNDKKADGSEKIVCGDTVSIYFSQQTLQKFMGRKAAPDDTDAAAGDPPAKTEIDPETRSALEKISVLYEDGHILAVNKPAGLLTQKAAKEDFSLNEWLISHLLTNGQLTAEEMQTFRPSACNRLDRNTSGIVLCAKSVQGAQMLSEALRTRSLHKFYRLYVKGTVSSERVIEGYLHKDEKSNQVQIFSTQKTGEGSYICTRYYPIRQEADKTLLEVELITGKSHQIRAHLASIGHPLLGDPKYGDKAWNEKYRRQYAVSHQLLHAYRVVFPKLEAPFADLSEKTFLAPLPELFDRVADA